MSGRKFSETLVGKFSKARGVSTSTSSSPTSSATPTSSSPSALPSFRFNKADEELVEIPAPAVVEELGEKQVIGSGAVATSEPIDTPTTSREEQSSSVEPSPPGSCSSLDVSSFSLHEPSPIKEAILTKFARLAPQSASSASLPAEHSTPAGSDASTASPSWLNQVKGKIAKTVEEKYTEYKHEREKRLASQVKNPQADEFNPLEGGVSYGEERVVPPLSHSLSETMITDSFSSSPDLKTSQSQTFAKPTSLNVTAANAESSDDDEDSKTPLVISEGLQRSSTPPPPGENPESPRTPKERRRFNFSFRDKTTKTPNQSATPDTASKTNDETSARGSLRSRVYSLMAKSGKGNSSSQLSSSPTLEDPFSGGMMNDLSPVGSPVAAGAFDQVEEAMEADEKLVFDPSQDQSEEVEDVICGEEQDSELKDEDASLIGQYWWVASLPLCVILFLQFMPLPSWLVGFTTGLIVGVPAAVFVMWRCFAQDTLEPQTKFIDNLRKKVPKRPAIIVQEELERKYTWMNMWPTQAGPYDPLSYDVRRTMSVRAVIYGPWLELRFPKRNLPLRRMFDDVEPKNVDFYDHKEVLDLTNCSLELTPENLPSKRVWSKKYPIKITTYVRKPCSEDQDTSKEVVPAAEPVPDPAEAKELRRIDQTEVRFSTVRRHLEQEFDLEDCFKDSNEEDSVNDAVSDDCSSNAAPSEVPKKDVDQDDEEEGFEILQETSRSFYLFARTSREKEEWFNRFMVGAKFMQDWNHQNPPKERTWRPDLKYETFKVKEQKFKIFMENYFQARHFEGANKVHDEILKDEVKRQVAREQVAFLNIFGARLWHDLHNSKVFVDLLREKLTRKLLKVKIAQYFEEVSVTTLDLGTQLPQILSASLPWQDENGLWANLEIEYNGICQATVETQGIRLPAKDEPDREAQELTGRQQATVDSDEEDSAEEDDEIPDSNENSHLAGGGGVEGQVHGAGFRARVLEGLLRSEFVAKVAESEWVKKNITGRNITLQLQLHMIKGTLTINLPPAPSDRIWYCFRTPPQLELALRPCFGGRSLGKYESTFSAVMRLLEKRLKQEFMKVVVYPNMDDEVLPFLEHVSYSLKS